MSRRIHFTAVLALALTLTAAMALAQTSTTTTPAAAPKTHATHATHSKMTAMPKVDLNTATKEELMKLPGVGDATADKIVAARPFKSKSELLSKKLVTRAEYSKLSSHVIAKSAEAKK